MYACPQCGSTDLEVTVEIWAKLIQDGDEIQTDTSTPKDGTHQWNENSVMRCLTCGEDNIAAEFQEGA